MSTQTIAVHLPDGAIREVPAGTTPLDIANSISPRLAAVVVVARLTPIGGAAKKMPRRRGWWTSQRHLPQIRGWNW